VASLFHRIVVATARRVDYVLPLMASPISKNKGNKLILTPGFGYFITPVPKFPDRPGRENRVHFSYARDKTTDQAAPDCPRGTQCLNVRIAAAIGEPGPAKRAVATGCSTPSVLNARQRILSHFTASTKPITGRLKRPVEADAESLQELL